MRSVAVEKRCRATLCLQIDTVQGWKPKEKIKKFKNQPLISKRPLIYEDSGLDILEKSESEAKGKYENRDIPQYGHKFVTQDNPSYGQEWSPYILDGN